MRKIEFSRQDREQRVGAPVAVLLPPTGSRRGAKTARPASEESIAGCDRGTGSGALDRARELAHDARNLWSAMDLYCELLAAPGVLAPQFRHYAEDLRRVGENGARLVEALANCARDVPREPAPAPLNIARHPFPGIRDLAGELLALEGPLQALAGAEIDLEVECGECSGELALNAEDLVRILFNLVANAVEAMRSQARSPSNRRRYLRITAQRGNGASFLPGPYPGAGTVVLAVRDNGPGIAAENLPYIFDPGFSTRGDAGRGEPRRGPALRPLEARPQPADADFHGLGLAIVRQLVESAGGAVRAVSTPGVGARFDIELPVTGADGSPGWRPGRTLGAAFAQAATGGRDTVRRAIRGGLAIQISTPEKISSDRTERRVQ